VTVLYGQLYRALVGLAALLAGDVTAAEELVQDSFVALHAAWPRLPGRDGGIAFLHRSVIQGSRVVTADRRKTAAPPGGSAVIAALRALPALQREAVVLRCCAGLADGQIAAAMGVSTAKARGHIARAMAVLRAELQADAGALTVRQGEPG
jgi:DNA-directed RNA polymerase specialized sigma24 family protein